MEKSWENFWTTGKVEDYLSYRGSISDRDTKEKQDEEKRNRQEGMTGTWDSR